MSFAEKNSTQKSGLAFPSKAGNRHQLEPFRLQLMTDILSAGHGAAMQDDLADVTFTDLPSDNARKSASAAYGIIMKTLTTTQRDTSWLAALEGAEPDMRLNGAWLFRRVMERKPRRMATLAARTKAREALHALMMAKLPLSGDGSVIDDYFTELLETSALLGLESDGALRPDQLVATITGAIPAALQRAWGDCKSQLREDATEGGQPAPDFGDLTTLVEALRTMYDTHRRGDAHGGQGAQGVRAPRRPWRLGAARPRSSSPRGGSVGATRRGPDVQPTRASRGGRDGGVPRLHEPGRARGVQHGDGRAVRQAGRHGHGHPFPFPKPPAGRPSAGGGVHRQDVHHLPAHRPQPARPRRGDMLRQRR